MFALLYQVMYQLLSSKHYQDESGLALLMTVATVAFLTIFIFQFNTLTRITAQETAHFRDGLKAAYLAKAGASAAQAVLLADAKKDKGMDGLHDKWAQPLSSLPLGEGTLSVSISDERGKFNLNNFTRVVDPDTFEEYIRQLRSLFLHLEENPNIVDSIVDWIDSNDEKRPFGAETSFYQSLPEPYWPKNGSIHNFQDVYLIKGMTEEIVAKLQPYITIYPISADGKININTAHPWILEGLHPQITPSLVARIVRARPFQDLFQIERVAGMKRIAQALRLQQAYQIHSDFFSVLSKGGVNDTTKIVQTILNRQGTNAITVLMYRID